MSLIVTLFTSYGSVGTVLQVGSQEVMKFGRGDATLTIQKGVVEIDGVLEENTAVYQLRGDVEIKSHTGALIHLVKLSDLVYPPTPTAPGSKEFWMELLEKRLTVSTNGIWKVRTRATLYCGNPISVYIPRPHMGEESPIVLLGSDQAFYASCHDHEIFIDPTTPELAYSFIGVNRKTREPVATNFGFTFNLSEEEAKKLIGEPA